MKPAEYFWRIVILSALIGASHSVEAADPATGPLTLWNFLGIPQGVQKIRDATVNRRGNHPQWERKPPLKAIADPANIESPNPAIKKAAEVKAEEDAAQQKVKAIKYLATVGCRCYPGVMEALQAALDDCSEEVRFEAAIAFCQAAGNPSTVCNENSCCSAEVMTKLQEMAFGKDAKGCWKEPSPRVRAAAENALNACREVHRPGTPAGLPPKPKEVPVEAPPKEVPSETPPAKPKADETSGIVNPIGFSQFTQDDEKSISRELKRIPAVDNPIKFSKFSEHTEPSESGTPGIINPLSFSEFAETPEVETVAFRGPCPPGYKPCRRCPLRYRRGRAGVGIIPEGAVIPPKSEEGMPEEEAAPPADALAGTYGAAAGPESAAMHMIGDSIGPSQQRTFLRIPVSGGDGSARGYLPADQASSFATGAGRETVLTPGEYNELPHPYHADIAVDGYADTWQITEVIANPGSQLHEYGVGNRFPADPAVSTATLNGGAVGDPAIQGNVTDIPWSDGKVAIDAIALVELSLPPAGVRTIKLVENNSVIPEDRIFFNYSFFNDVNLSGGGVIDVNRYLFGVEKTFFYGICSVELRVPFASTLNSEQSTLGINLTNTEFGDVALITKAVLRRTERAVLAGGLGLSVPTADDTQLFRRDGTELVHVHNDTVHLLPFFGLLLTPNDRFFVQSFLQFDIDSNGNRVYGQYQLDDLQSQFQQAQGAGGLPALGTLYDQSLMFADVSFGYWLWRDPSARRMTGVVPTLELHYTTSLNDRSEVSDDTGAIRVVSNDANRFDYLNLTAGVHFVFGTANTITPALVMPLRSGDDDQFDYEFQLQANVVF